MESFRGNARYQLVRELGVGGMGVVYEAIDNERGGRRVALKVLQGQDADSLVRLKREFRSLHDVRHPNLVSLYELTADGDVWFFTLELIDGVDFLSWVRPSAQLAAGAETADLSTTVRSPGPPMVRVDVERVTSAFRQLAEGVAFLHARDRVHRDLKPANVLVTREGRVVVLDFGLVAELGGPRSLTEEQGRAIVGTVAYMAPEQAASGPVGAASDWYAFGVMLFQALTGRLPFEGAPVDVVMDKQRRPAPSPRELNASAPELLSELCVRLLQTQPAGRPDGREVLAALGAGSRPQPPRATLVGRDDALATLERAFEITQAEGPRVVRVQGPPGIGKTAALKAFAQRVEALGAVVLAGRCHERETVPFKAIDPLIDALTRHLAAQPAERIDGLRPRDAWLLGRMFPALNRVAAFRDAPVREVPEPLERRRRAILALRELFERLGERVPLVLLIDDAQWGDADSVALMEAVLRPPEPPRVLVVTSIRDDGPALPPGTVPIEVLALAPLAQDAALEVARRAGADEARATACAQESGGNPLLLLQLLEMAGQGEVTVDALWRRKVTALEAPARRLLEVIAVAAVPVDAVLAAEVAGLGPRQADLVPLLEGLHLVRLLPDERRLEAWHERLGEAVVAGLEAGRVSALHERLASAMEAQPNADLDAVAFHFSAAGHGDRAAEATIKAAASARDQLAFARAAALYRRALELLPLDDRRRFELAVAQGACLADAGQGKVAAEAYARARGEPGAHPAVAEELPRLAAEQLLVSGHVDEGLAALSGVLAGLKMTLAKTPSRAVGALLFRRLHLALRGLSFDERTALEVDGAMLRRIDACWSVSVGLAMIDTIRGSSFQTRQLLLALDAGEPWRISRALAAEAAFVATEGQRSERRARELIERASSLCERVGDARLRGLLAFCEGLTRFLVGDFKAAKAKVAEAEALLRDAGLGVSWEAANARLFSVWSLFYLGELAELTRRVPALVREAHSRGDRYAVTSLTVGLANVSLLAADRPHEARKAVAAAMAAWPSKGFHFQHYWAVLSEGLFGLYEGAPRPALEQLLAAWPSLERTMLLRIQNVRVEALSLKGRLAVAAGQGALAAEVVRALSKERVGWAQAQALVLTAGLEPSRASRCLSEAIALFEQHDMRLFAAAARLRLGALQPAELGAANQRLARAWFETQDVKNPDAFARMLVPQR
ncbi:MAG: serine/threonine-protein kinase PknK [Myxococcus sp.]|nr:serine/threonine-protein kinase PknK [Myxococcus sp.]